MVNATFLPIFLIGLYFWRQLRGSRDEKSTSLSRNLIEGARVFRYHYAACHGADGRGDGPASAALKHAVPDLTLISQRNGGKFPCEQVKEKSRENNLDPSHVTRSAWKQQQ
jgi:mono/diheme cytochrome c family protein